MKLLDYERWPSVSKSVYGSVKAKLDSRPSSIVIAGMGGSGIVGDVVRDYLVDRLPIHVVKDLAMPSWVGAGTLTIAVSYSGNTAETICSAMQARSRGSTVVGVTTGGTMMDEFKRLGMQVIQVPKATAPRFGFPQLLYAVLSIIDQAIGIDAKDVEESIAAQEEALGSAGLAASIGQELLGRVPYIFVDSKIYGVAMRFKNDLNENAKTPAIVAPVPEADHNDIVTLMMSHPVRHVLIREAGPNPIMDVVETVFRDFSIVPIKVELMGRSVLAQELYGITLLGMATLQMAEQLGVDPVRTDPIDVLKKRLGRLC